MMYGFGDVAKPLEESINVVEELAIMYMRDLAANAANQSRRDVIKTSDVLFAVRKDAKKMWRGREALSFHKAQEQYKAETSMKDPAATGRWYGDK